MTSSCKRLLLPSCGVVTQGANKVSWTQLEEKQHEDNVGHLSESQTSSQRRLGVRQRWEVYWEIFEELYYCRNYSKHLWKLFTAILEQRYLFNTPQFKTWKSLNLDPEILYVSVAFFAFGILLPKVKTHGIDKKFFKIVSLMWSKQCDLTLSPLPSPLSPLPSPLSSFLQTWMRARGISKQRNVPCVHASIASTIAATDSKMARMRTKSHNLWIMTRWAF